MVFSLLYYSGQCSCEQEGQQSIACVNRVSTGIHIREEMV